MTGGPRGLKSLSIFSCSSLCLSVSAGGPCIVLLVHRWDGPFLHTQAQCNSCVVVADTVNRKYVFEINWLK